MEILKRALAIAFLAASAAFASDIASDQFGYLNSNESPAIIDANQAQDLLNVDVTPNGRSVKKRSGYGVFKTLSTSQAIHGAYHFFDSAGNDVQIWGSSTSLWGIVADGTPTQLVSSATINSTWQCTDAQGFAYCVDSNRDALIKTNGATMTWYNSPLGTMDAITPERLLVAGSSSTPNTIAYSAASNFTNFSVGINASDASTEQIAAPGSKLTHLAYACNRWLWWKDQSFGYILGTDQTNLVIKSVSNNIGTLDNSDAIDPNGNVYFRGQDGHVYMYDCNSLTKLTTDISPSVTASGRRLTNSWAITTASDFNSGSTSSTTVTSAPGVQISTTNVNPPDNSFESGLWSGTGGRWNAVNSVSTFHCGTITPKDGSSLMQYNLIFGGSLSWTASVLDASTNASYGSASGSYGSTICSWGLNTISVSAPAKTLVYIKISFLNDAQTITSPSFAASGSTVTFYEASDQTGSSQSSVFYDFFQGGQTDLTSGIYYSPVHNNANITNWDVFTAVTTTNGGTHSFSIRASTNVFTILSSTPAWTSQTVGSVPTISTGAYVQWKDTFTVTASSQNPVLSGVTVNWFEGTASDKAYATYFDNAIWWSLAYGSGQSTNNYIFKYDLLTPGWTLYNFGAGGFLIENNKLYFGATDTSGNIYKFGNGTSDNGAAINAYWKSKDFPGGDVFLENNYRQVDVLARQNSNQTLTVGWTTNGGTSETGNFSVNLSSSTNGTIRYKKLLPNSAVGGLINLKFYDNTTTSSWEVLGYRIRYDPLNYAPSR